MERKPSIAIIVFSSIINLILGASVLYHFSITEFNYYDAILPILILGLYFILTMGLIGLINWARVCLMGITFVLIVINLLLALLYTQPYFIDEFCEMPEVAKFNICFVVVFTAYFFFLNNSKVKEQFK